MQLLPHELSLLPPPPESPPPKSNQEIDESLDELREENIHRDALEELYLPILFSFLIVFLISTQKKIKFITNKIITTIIYAGHDICENANKNITITDIITTNG